MMKMKSDYKYSFITWIFTPIFIDYERIHRKSKGLLGYIESIRFYKYAFDLACKQYGLKKVVKEYYEDTKDYFS